MKPESWSVGSRLEPRAVASNFPEGLTKSMNWLPCMDSVNNSINVPDPSLLPGTQKSFPVDVSTGLEWLCEAAPGAAGRRSAHSSGGGGGLLANVASTDASAARLTVHPPLPEHASPQPANVQPAAEVAVSVTLAPSLKLAAQALPQSIPAGCEVTLPVPFTLTLST